MKNEKFLIEPTTKQKSKKHLLVISPHLSQLMGFGQGKLSCLDFSQDDPISSIYQSDIFLLTPRNLIVNLVLKILILLVSVLWIQLGEKLRQILQFQQEYKLS